MIKSFRHKGLESLFHRDDGKKLPPELLDRIRSIFSVMDSATKVEEINLPTFRLHPLRGDMKGYWAITVRANWQIKFRFAESNCLELDFLDYH